MYVPATKFTYDLFYLKYRTQIALFVSSKKHSALKPKIHTQYSHDINGAVRCMLLQFPVV